jgi:hypothetical protein
VAKILDNFSNVQQRNPDVGNANLLEYFMRKMVVGWTG